MFYFFTERQSSVLNSLFDASDLMATATSNIDPVLTNPDVLKKGNNNNQFCIFNVEVLMPHTGLIVCLNFNNVYLFLTL